MLSFNYIAKGKSGQTIKGIVEAKSETEASEILHKQELFVIAIEQSKVAVSVRKKTGKVGIDDIVIFSRQLATMIDAGIPLVQSLNILAEQIEQPVLRNVVSSVQQDIEGGMSFCDALAKHPNIFSDLFVSMAKAGETSGMLDQVLDRLASYLEKAASLSRKVRSSMIYPVVVLIVAFAITSLLLIKVVPTFKGIFDSLGGTLPLPTRILVGISDIFKKWFPIVIGGFFVAGFIFKRYAATVRGRYNIDYQKLRLPVAGELFRKVGVAKFSRTFATLMKSGVPVLNALDIVASTSGNKVIEETILNCRNAVREGEPIYKPLSKSKIFPAMVCRMISVGEQTGQLEKMLSKIADFYDEQVDVAVSGLTSMIEPLVIVFLGGIIGGIVVALFMPIFQLTEMINR
ncbi:MAG: type II secretion system F family protein [Candidatus Omnitrophica bacterium]|jgi:type IV pilus assembly protein PilC|nr:type II secretion system F family protein [Candidatus Omnitrophota bacterium]